MAVWSVAVEPGRLPVIGAPIVPSAFGQRYAAGLVEERGRRLFVTPGVGTSIVPVRFGVRRRYRS